MVGLSLIPLIAFLVGLCLRGTWRGWQAPTLTWWPFAAGALAVQLLLFSPPLNAQPWVIAAGPWIWVASMVAVVVVLVRNGLRSERRSRPLLVAALGVGLNVVVVTANGGYMPQSPEARALAKPRAAALETGAVLQNVRPMTADTRLPWLGDVIPQPSWLPFASVVSFGDVLLSAGLALWAYAAAKEPVGRGETDTHAARELAVEPR